MIYNTKYKKNKKNSPIQKLKCNILIKLFKKKEETIENNIIKIS